MVYIFLNRLTFFSEEEAAQGGEETENTTDLIFDTMVWRARERERLESSVPLEVVDAPRRSSRVLEEKAKAAQAERARSAEPAKPKAAPRRRTRSVVVIAPHEAQDPLVFPFLPGDVPELCPYWTWRDHRYCT